MRAREFINETVKIVKTGVKMPKEHEATLPGTHRVAGTADRHYDLARVMMYVAASDGKNFPGIPKQSWAGRNNTAHPYSKIEAEMLKHAYQMADVEWDDVLKPNSDNKSVELKDTNKQSPVAAFSGYKWRKSK
jgi:hypothetical protein